ncbi:MAG: SCO family protein [Pseudomonadota bacterium]
MIARAALAAACLLGGAALAQNAPPLPGAGAGTPFPLALGGAFELTDQNGAPRGHADPDGNLQLLFFGYANCAAICTVALPLMADITDIAAEDGLTVTPVMVTVDPARDTVASIGPALRDYHDDFVGLTGSEDDLAPVYDLFSVDHSVIFHDPEYGDVYAHGSHIYLLDGQGEVLTMLPPVLDADHAAGIVATYAGPPLEG